MAEPSFDSDVAWLAGVGLITSDQHEWVKANRQFAHDQCFMAGADTRGRAALVIQALYHSQGEKRVLAFAAPADSPVGGSDV